MLLLTSYIPDSISDIPGFNIHASIAHSTGIECNNTCFVAEALFTIFSRLGVPKIIASDSGSQFTTVMMAEVSNLLGLASTEPR